MKTFSLLFVVCIGCSLSASAQISGGAMSAPVQGMSFSEHPQRASQTSLGTEQNLIGHSMSGYAHGERPLWELMPLAEETPLGDLAREARKQHESAKKATKVWSN